MKNTHKFNRGCFILFMFSCSIMFSCSADAKKRPSEDMMKHLITNQFDGMILEPTNTKMRPGVCENVKIELEFIKYGKYNEQFQYLVVRTRVKGSCPHIKDFYFDKTIDIQFSKNDFDEWKIQHIQW